MITGDLTTVPSLACHRRDHPMVGDRTLVGGIPFPRWHALLHIFVIPLLFHVYLEGFCDERERRQGCLSFYPRPHVIPPVFSWLFLAFFAGSPTILLP